MKRKFTAVLAAALAATTALATAGCGTGTQPSADATGPVSLTMSGWSLATTREFKLLADGFHAANPNITITLKDYDASQYNTLVTADLAAGTGPDIITQKEVKYVTTFQAGGQLLDISDVKLPDGLGGADSYKIDGKQYAVPYRQDAWVLFYNKDLFDKAGVAIPDGSWTWDDYVAKAKELKTKLAAAGSQASGAYEHSWNSTVQGFANAQAPNGDVLGGSYGYMKPYYERVLDLQKSGAQVDFNTLKANQLSYSAEFGKQHAAMMLMGTWQVSTLITQQGSGDADTFAWGMAPAPQYDATTTGTSKTPVTFGDPTGFGVNAKSDAAKQAAAKKFVAYAATEEAAKILTGIGITPSLLNDSVVSTYFATKGAPQDSLSKFAFSKHVVKPQNPTSPKIAAVQNILSDMHSSIMSGSQGVDAAIAQAEARIKSEVS